MLNDFFVDRYCISIQIGIAVTLSLGRASMTMQVFGAWQGAARQKKLYRTVVSRFKSRTVQGVSQLVLLEWHKLAAARAATKRRVARLVA